MVSSVKCAFAKHHSPSVSPGPAPPLLCLPNHAPCHRHGVLPNPLPSTLPVPDPVPIPTAFSIHVLAALLHRLFHYPISRANAHRRRHGFGPPGPAPPLWSLTMPLVTVTVSTPIPCPSHFLCLTPYPFSLPSPSMFLLLCFIGLSNCPNTEPMPIDTVTVSVLQALPHHY